MPLVPATLPLSKRVAGHIQPIEGRPDLALEPSNIAVSYHGCNVRRGRNAKLPDLPRAAVPREAVSVGARMNEILGVDR